MKNLKKNQIVIFVIGLMIITAGYLSYSNNVNNVNTLETGALLDSEEMASIGDARLVSANISDENALYENSISNSSIESEIINEVKINNINELNTNTAVEKNEIVVSSASKAEESNEDYFVNSRLERTTIYSQKIEIYKDILNNTNINEAQKKVAEQEIKRLSNEQSGIMIAENLIKTKGIEDLVIFVNNGSINVILKGKEPKKEEIAQIQNIITRELEAEIEDIHIMNYE